MELFAIMISLRLNSCFALLALVKSPGMTRSRLNLRLRLAFAKCSYYITEYVSRETFMKDLSPDTTI